MRKSRLPLVLIQVSIERFIIIKRGGARVPSHRRLVFVLAFGFFAFCDLPSFFAGIVAT